MIYSSVITFIDHLFTVDQRVTGRSETLKCKTSMLITFHFPLKRQPPNRCCPRTLNPGRYRLFNKKPYQISNRLKPPSAHGKTLFFTNLPLVHQKESFLKIAKWFKKKNITITEVKLSCKWKRIPKLVKHRFFHPWMRNEVPVAVCISSFSNTKKCCTCHKKNEEAAWLRIL